MNTKVKRTALFAVATAVACGDAGSPHDGNTVGYSGPVVVRLDKFKHDDVRNESFDSDKSINSESGNPYGAFLNQARAVLGRPPAAVLLESATITLDGSSTGVTTIDQFLTASPSAPLTLYFANSGTTVNVGTLTVPPRGPGPVSIQITATRATLAPINNELVQGSFKVGIRVPAAPGRPARFDAKLSTVLTFRALAL
jgi:hypothetical protein